MYSRDQMRLLRHSTGRTETSRSIQGGCLEEMAGVSLVIRRAGKDMGKSPALKDHKGFIVPKAECWEGGFSDQESQHLTKKFSFYYVGRKKPSRVSMGAGEWHFISFRA